LPLSGRAKLVRKLRIHQTEIIFENSTAGMESLWSDANSIGSQGAAFFLPDTAKYQATLKLEMRNWRQVDASFIQGSELKLDSL